MAQEPAKRHVLAEVRIQCGLTQPELAKAVGCAPVSIQKIEQGILRLSESLASKIEEQLGVSSGWLLANNPKVRPITPRGGFWSKELYELAQGIIKTAQATSRLENLAVAVLRPEVKKHYGLEDKLSAIALLDSTSKIDAMLQGSRGSPRQGILMYRLAKAIDGLLEEFKPDPATLKTYAPRIERLHDAFFTSAEQLRREEIGETGPMGPKHSTARRK